MNNMYYHIPLIWPYVTLLFLKVNSGSERNNTAELRNSKIIALGSEKFARSEIEIEDS